MKHKLFLAAAVSLAMASTAMAQTSSGTSDTTSGASSDTSATTSGSTTASPGMLQMTEAEKSTTANWSGAISDAFFADSTMTSLKSADEIRSNWSSLTPEQQAQVEQDCNTMQTASAPAAPTTDSGTATGTSTDTTASTSGTTGTTTGTTGTTGETTASTDTTGTATGTTGTSGETTASTTTGTAGSMSDPMTVAQLCEFVGSL